MYHIRAGFPETYNLCQVHQNYHIFKHAIPYEKNENRYRVFPNETFKNNVQILYSGSIHQYGQINSVEFSLEIFVFLIIPIVTIPCPLVV